MTLGDAGRIFHRAKIDLLTISSSAIDLTQPKIIEKDFACRKDNGATVIGEKFNIFAQSLTELRQRFKTM